uniref:Uncharacterized protein n=1 Tax=Arundo donax TaxID=35708 RepID=A0A0A9AS10_ARUDO
MLDMLARDRSRLFAPRHETFSELSFLNLYSVLCMLRLQKSL